MDCSVYPSHRRGRNTYGQLGAGDTEDRLDEADEELVTVDLGDSAALAIAAGESHVCVLLTDSTMKVKSPANYVLLILSHPASIWHTVIEAQ